MCRKAILLPCLIAVGALWVQPGWGSAAASDDEIKAVHGTTSLARPEVAGVVLRDKLVDFEIRDAAGKVVSQGQLQDRVVRSTRKNALVFLFRIRNTKPALPGRISEVRRDGFKGWKTDMDYSLDGLGTIGPDSVKRLPRRGSVGFSFRKTPIASGAESRFCFVLTDATGFDPTGGSLAIIANDGSKVILRVAAPKK